MIPNIIFRAPVYSQSGYGLHSRDIIISLWDSQKFNILLVPTGWGASSISIDSLSTREKEVFSFMTNNLFHKDANFIFVHIGIPTEFQKIGKINVGITAGLESNMITKQWVDGCNLMDIVIVPSKIIKDVFINSGVTTRIEVIEEGVNTSIFNDIPIKIDNDFLDFIETDNNLLSIGQWLPGDIGEDRKGIGLLVDTFIKTFEENKKVGLILKTYLNNNSSTDYTYLYQRLQELKQNKKYPKIYLIHGNLNDQEMSYLYKHPKIKGYVSLTSGEGWGRGIAEAISCNVPVIVTGWGGHMHYIDPNYVQVVDYKLKNVPKSALMTEFFTPEMVWAYPEVNDAKRKMTLLVENPIMNKERAIKYGKIFRNTFSKEKVYTKLIELFEELGEKVEYQNLNNTLSLVNYSTTKVGSF